MREELADMLTADEGLRLKVYDDHNGEPIKKGSTVEGYPTNRHRKRVKSVWYNRR